MSKTALTSLALLKVNWDNYQKSYTDNFAPLAAECIRKSGLKVISLVELQARMLADFGLRIPSHSLKVVLGRLKRSGLLRQDHNAYLPVSDKLASVSIEETRQKVLRQHQSTIENLRDFCRTKYGVNWTEKEAEDALISYLKVYDLDVFLAASEGTPLPEVERPVPNASFLVNAFVREIYQSNATAFAYLETIVKGHLLANALVFPEVSEVTRKFDRTKVFFDTRPILNSLGYGGPYFGAASRDLLELLYEAGAELRCFRHTYDEVHGILNACARSQRMTKPLEGAIGLALIFQGSSESDILLAIATLERDIRRLRMSIDDKPPYVPELQVSEGDLDALLQKEIGYVNERAKIRDVDSLSAVYRLRHSRNYHYIEDCRAIFVTTNTKLIRTSGKFFESYQERSSPPICISDHHLTNILWLKKPSLLSDLPKKQIIADAYAAMEPSPELWRRFLAEVEKLKTRGDIKAEDYLLLRNSIEIRSHVMDVTLGDEAALVEGTVSEVLEAYTSSIQAEADERRIEAEGRERKLERDLGKVTERIESFSQMAAVVVGRSAFVLFVALLSLGAYSSATSHSLHHLGWVLSVMAILLIIFSLVHMIWGGSVRIVVRRIEGGVRRFVFRKLARRFLGDAH